MSEFVHYLKEVFEPFGEVSARRMFGGYGLYHDGLMFGLVAGDVLYLNADDKTAGAFAGLGLPQFEYAKAGKKISMSYYLAPEGIFDDPEEARRWAVLAYEAALRSRKPQAAAKSRG